MLRDGSMLALGVVALLVGASSVRGRGSRAVTDSRRQVIETAIWYGPEYVSQMGRDWPVREVIIAKLYENATGTRPAFPSGARPLQLQAAQEALGEEAAAKLFRDVLLAYARGGAAEVRRLADVVSAT